MRLGDFKYRLTDQPGGWFGNTVKVDWPILVNLRLDPFERTGLNQSLFAKDWWQYEFWLSCSFRTKSGDTHRESFASLLLP